MSETSLGLYCSTFIHNINVVLPRAPKEVDHLSENPGPMLLHLRGHGNHLQEAFFHHALLHDVSPIHTLNHVDH